MSGVDGGQGGVVAPWPRREPDPSTPDTPVPGPGTALVPDTAIEGEVLTEEQSRALDRRLSTGRVRPVWTGTVRTVRVVRTVATHPATKTTGRVLLRHSLAYPIAGVG